LHLDEQAGLGVVVDGRCVGETDRHTEAGQFVHDQDLVGELTSEAVRGQAPHRFESARLGRVAQGIEAGPVEAGPGVAVVYVGGHDLVSLRSGTRRERLEL
jgi:hypothetical protein